VARIAYFDCFSGASGDMILGALLQCGVRTGELGEYFRRLDLGHWSLTAEPVTRHGIAGFRVVVECTEEQEHGRHLGDIEDLIRQAGLPAVVEERAIAVFRRLAEAEAAIHQRDVQSLHFHEVGAVDAVVDIVGACALLDILNVSEVVCSPLPMGRGFVECMHGTIPLPAPAVAELTKGCPVYGVDVEAELVTPTGAAILTTLASRFGPMPPMKVAEVGYGAGSRELADRPNLLRVFIGETASPPDRDEVAVVETNIDDLSPQFYEAAIERLFKAGALDVFTQPIYMKKNRPAVLLSVICPPELVDAVAEVMFAETSTIGVRIMKAERRCMNRWIEVVSTEFGDIRMKVAQWQDTATKAMPEYDDIRRLADEKGVPVQQVWEAAMAAYRNKKGV